MYETSLASHPKATYNGLWQFVTMKPTKPLLADQVFMLSPKQNPPVEPTSHWATSVFRVSVTGRRRPDQHKYDDHSFLAGKPPDTLFIYIYIYPSGSNPEVAQWPKLSLGDLAWSTA